MYSYGTYLVQYPFRAVQLDGSFINGKGNVCIDYIDLAIIAVVFLRVAYLTSDHTPEQLVRGSAIWAAIFATQCWVI
jgi:hypothetical protein